MGLEALASCVLSGVALPWQGLPDTRTAPWLCYAQHLIFTLLTIAATVPHILIAWLQRPGTELASGASGWLRMGLWVLAARTLPHCGAFVCILWNEVLQRVPGRL